MKENNDDKGFLGAASSKEGAVGSNPTPRTFQRTHRTLRRTLVFGEISTPSISINLLEASRTQ